MLKPKPRQTLADERMARLQRAAGAQTRAEPVTPTIQHGLEAELRRSRLTVAA